MASNAELKVMGDDLENLILAFQIAFSNFSKGTEGYTVSNKEMVFYWLNPKLEDFVKLPFLMDYKKAVQFANDWLEQVNYPEEPDQDGSNKKGWIVYRDFWGHVNGSPYAIVAVKPNWSMYGK